MCISWGRAFGARLEFLICCDFVSIIVVVACWRVFLSPLKAPGTRVSLGLFAVTAYGGIVGDSAGGCKLKKFGVYIGFGVGYGVGIRREVWLDSGLWV
ncbi:MAG: hypothetical protein MPL62_06310 [Alphaproteobacteria bacterium]|nr:hypothetical protein [Alphaproteobacteria bacterium]MDA8000892.1 hypothetical protein [Alphaproteobacteria bacterium]